ncbi:MAG: Rieske 2Fe-2S domain-containing protein [Actinobacteria bacterium]|nr:Rieske 2Fe-2S domain-containing protein [Actinomycetota bacterium]
MERRHPANRIDVGSVDDLRAGPRRVEVDGTALVVAEVGDEVTVAVDRCPHRGAPLSAGTVEHGCIVCPYHGWAFGPAGEVAAIPALGPDAALPRRARLRTVAAEVRDGRVLVDASTVDRPAAPALAMGNDDDALADGWHPVGRSDEVPAGGRVGFRLLGRTFEVERDPTGGLHCRSAHAVTDHVGHVWLAPDEPAADLLDIAEFGEDGWHHVAMPRVEGRYGVGLLLDNQLDAGHFSFVHRATFGSGSDAALPPYEIERHAGGFEVRMRVPITPRNDVSAAAGERPTTQHRNMTYRYRAPTTLFLRLDYEEMGGSTGILFCFAPLDRDTARMDVDLLFRHPDGFTEEQLAQRLAFEVQVVGEDLALQDRFDTLFFNDTATTEIYTRADRSSVEMRRILAAFYRMAVSSPMPMRASSEVSIA